MFTFETKVIPLVNLIEISLDIYQLVTTLNTKTSNVFVHDCALTPPGALRNMTSPDRNSL